jgi:hypothetical protein
MKQKTVSTNEHHFYPTANPQPTAGVVVTKDGGAVWSWAAWLVDVDHKPHIVARGKTPASGLHPHVTAAREGFAALERHLATLITSLDRAKKAPVQDL